MALSNGAMLLHLPAVAAINQGNCEKDVTEKACCKSTYNICKGQVCLNLETAGQTWLNCHLVFHNTCYRSYGTWLIAHFMLAFAACSGHLGIAFGEETLLTTWNHYVVYKLNEQQQVQSFCMEKALFKTFILFSLKPQFSKSSGSWVKHHSLPLVWLYSDPLG